MTNPNRLKGQFLKAEEIKKLPKKPVGELHTVNCRGFNSNGVMPHRRGQL
jgi:hypothetical protein